MSYIERDESLKETVIVVRDWKMSYIEGDESLSKRDCICGKRLANAIYRGR